LLQCLNLYRQHGGDTVMVRVHRLLSAAIILTAGLVCANTANAGPLRDWFLPEDGQSPSYSPFRYWTPRLARVNDAVHGPSLNVYAPDRHPEIPPTYTILKFTRPAVDPAATLIEPPSAPASSRFRY
jgi:hypothetical protein